MSVSIAWTLALNAGITIGDTSGFEGVCDIGAGRLLAITVNGNVFRSADYGVTWTLIVSPIDADGNFLARCFSPTTDVAFTAQNAVGVGGNTDTMNIWRTTDGGTSWAKVYTYVSGLPLTCYVLAYDFAAIQPDTYLAAGRFADTGVTNPTHAFARSLDSGASWAKFATIDLATSGNSYENVLVLASGRILASRMCADDVGSDPFNGKIAIWYSDDSGATWIQSGDFPGAYPWQNGAPGATNKNIWALEEVASNVVLAGGGFINDDDLGAAPTRQRIWVWRSTDGGETWASIPVADIQDYTNDNVAVGWITKLDTNIAVLGYGWTNGTADEPGWRLTEDGGVTWTNTSMTWDAPPDGTFYSPSQMVFFRDPADSTQGTIVSAAALYEGASGNSEIWLGAVTGLPALQVPHLLRSRVWILG